MEAASPVGQFSANCAADSVCTPEDCQTLCAVSIEINWKYGHAGHGAQCCVNLGTFCSKIFSCQKIPFLGYNIYISVYLYLYIYSQAQADCEMFAHVITPGPEPNPVTCFLLKADAWNVAESGWETTAIPTFAGTTVTVGPKSGCRRPDWSSG